MLSRLRLFVEYLGSINETSIIQKPLQYRPTVYHNEKYISHNCLNLRGFRIRDKDMCEKKILIDFYKI